MDLVTVASFRQPYEAHLAAARLRDAEIPCYVADEQMATMNPFYSQATGGVKVRVPADRVEEARAIIASLEDLPADETSWYEAAKCPACGSTEVEPARKGGLFGWLLPFGSGAVRYSCRACGETWTP
jgi:predicted RNA-binding Zn-ribbon protein involved in translation (DUF1610 family)